MEPVSVTDKPLPYLGLVKTSILQRVAAGAVVVSFVILALANSATKRPGCDEAWFASPAWNLASHGHMGTTILEPANSWENGRNHHGIDRHTFWIMPLSPVVQAAWYRVVPFSLMSTRLLSVIWGLVAIGAWFYIMLKTSGSELVALAASSLIAADYVFIRSASFARMDMMSAALTFCAYAAYLYFRERNLNLAIFAGHTLAAAALFTHPNGIFAITILALACLMLDLRRLGRWHVILTIIPYTLGAFAWAFYIAQAPSDFWAQISGNAAGRLSGLGSPLSSLYLELRDRYSGGGSASKLLLFSPLLLGLAGVLATPALRRQRAYQLLILLAGIEVVYFWLFESTRLYLYLVYLTPILDALLAVWLVYVWPKHRMLVIATVLVFALINVSGSAYVIKRNNLQEGFGPSADYLISHAGKGELIMGTGSLAFALGWDRGLLDDMKLGYASGKHPEWIVLEQRYREEFDWLRRFEPAAYEYVVKTVENDCKSVFTHSTYTVYRCGSNEKSKTGVSRRPKTSAEISNSPEILAQPPLVAQ